MSRLIVLGCIAYLVTGFGQLVIGSVMEPMVHAYGIHYGDGGQLVMHQFLGGMFGILCAPWLMNKHGKKFVLLLAIGLIVAAEFLYTLLPPWRVMLTIAPFAGVGLGMTEAVVGSFIISASGEKANTAMSRVETFFGVGALLIPFAGAALIEAGVWKLSFGIVSLLAAATFLLWLIKWPDVLNQAEQPVQPAHSHGARSGTMPAQRDYRRRNRLILTACALFFVIYVGLEMSYVHYLPSLLVISNGMTESSATLTLSIFWGAMVLGRLISGQLADRIGGAMYLLITCLTASVLFTLMTFMTGTVPALILIFLVGVMMSGMFAIALVFANRAVPGVTELTTSLLMACGGIGGALLPKAAGWFLDAYGPGPTRWLFAGITFALLLVMLWASIAARQAGRGAVLAAEEHAHSL
ncbi:MFS transporter [Paenibacillus sp. R14(2021)]|uniref:MFS transporter n=1 Tax=Paenibacillus sp. R14(2021) TaxID=2859228 RepID=UPI0021576148|nr:MFS transporter [Paenibacillus sp. R14(2021)]